MKPDPAEALADHIFGRTDAELILLAQTGPALVRWSKERFVEMVRQFFPPQKPKRNRRAK